MERLNERLTEKDAELNSLQLRLDASKEAIKELDNKLESEKEGLKAIQVRTRCLFTNEDIHEVFSFFGRYINPIRVIYFTIN